MAFLTLLIIVAIFAPLVAPYDPVGQDLPRRLEPPSREFLLGTDAFGRDSFSRVIFGARVSLLVAFATVALIILIGTTVGILAAYYRWLDGPLMRIVDLLMAMPPLFLLIMLVALFGAGTGHTVLFIAVSYWRTTARYVRGQVLSLKHRDYVKAALASGASDLRIFVRHIIPNISDGLIVIATLSISFVILLETALSYLGLGAQPPTPSWGGMLADGRQYLQISWWLTAFPGLAIFLTVMAFNFVGDGLRDAFDSRSAKAV
jgi:peptide/nickel transport system permease protein